MVNPCKYTCECIWLPWWSHRLSDWCDSQTAPRALWNEEPHVYCQKHPDAFEWFCHFQGKHSLNIHPVWWWCVEYTVRLGKALLAHIVLKTPLRRVGTMEHTSSDHRVKLWIKIGIRNLCWNDTINLLHSPNFVLFLQEDQKVLVR